MWESINGWLEIRVNFQDIPVLADVRKYFNPGWVDPIQLKARLQNAYVSVQARQARQPRAQRNQRPRSRDSRKNFE